MKTSEYKEFYSLMYVSYGWNRQFFKLGKYITEINCSWWLQKIGSSVGFIHNPL